MKITLIALLLVVSFSIYAQKSKQDTADTTAKITDTTAFISLKDMDRFFGVLETEVKGNNGVSISLTTAQFKLLSALFNETMRPAIERWYNQRKAKK